MVGHGWKGITSWKEYLWLLRVLICLGQLPCGRDFILASVSRYFLCVWPWGNLMLLVVPENRSSHHCFSDSSHLTKICDTASTTSLSPILFLELWAAPTLILIRWFVGVVSAEIYTTIFSRLICCVLLFQDGVGLVVFCLSLKAFVPAQWLLGYPMEGNRFREGRGHWTWWVRSLTLARLPPALKVQSWQVHMALGIRKASLKQN